MWLTPSGRGSKLALMRVILNKTSRHTRQKQTILRIVKTSPQALTAEQVWQTAKPHLGGLGLATVYRNLKHLSSHGEIVQVIDDRGHRRYFGRAIHQGWFRCQRCGRQETLAGTDWSNYLPNIFPQKIFGSQLRVDGWCSNCQKIILRLELTR